MKVLGFILVGASVAATVWSMHRLAQYEKQRGATLTVWQLLVRSGGLWREYLIIKPLLIAGVIILYIAYTS